MKNLDAKNIHAYYETDFCDFKEDEHCKLRIVF